MNPAIIRAYEEIALERPHVCTGCMGKQYLSHSHLIPRSYSDKYEAVKENITYHCMSQANDCHVMWEGMAAPLLSDFIENMKYILRTDRTYFYKKFFKLDQWWRMDVNNKHRKLVLDKLTKIEVLANNPHLL